MRKTTLIILSLFVFSTMSWAKPSPWFIYQNKQSGQRLCLDYDPGKSWVRMNGPYRDAGCRVTRR